MTIESIRHDAETIASKYVKLSRQYREVGKELHDMLYEVWPSGVPELNIPMQRLQKIEPSNDTIIAIEGHPFTLSDVIGIGNFGKVFAASTGDGTTVAIKIVPKKRMLSQRAVLRLAAQLTVLTEPDPAERHPNILYVDYALHSTRALYLVMPRLSGDLYNLMERYKTGLDETMAMTIIASVLGALAHLQTRGFAHRDVKSENILIEYTQGDQDGLQVTDVRVIDFDSCCAVAHESILADAPRADAPVKPPGSFGFMSPETLSNTVADPSLADVWSAGCVLMEMVTGPRWFTEEWLQIYRDHKGQIARPGGLDIAQAQEVADRLSACTVRVLGTLQDPTVRSVLENSLRIDPTVRTPAAELLALFPGT